MLTFFVRLLFVFFAQAAWTSFAQNSITVINMNSRDHRECIEAFNTTYLGNLQTLFDNIRETDNVVQNGRQILTNDWAKEFGLGIKATQAQADHMNNDLKLTQVYLARKSAEAKIHFDRASGHATSAIELSKLAETQYFTEIESNGNLRQYIEQCQSYFNQRDGQLNDLRDEIRQRKEELESIYYSMRQLATFVIPAIAITSLDKLHELPKNIKNIIDGITALNGRLQGLASRLRTHPDDSGKAENAAQAIDRLTSAEGIASTLTIQLVASMIDNAIRFVTCPLPGVCRQINDKYDRDRLEAQAKASEGVFTLAAAIVALREAETLNQQQTEEINQFRNGYRNSGPILSNFDTHVRNGQQTNAEMRVIADNALEAAKVGAERNFRYNQTTYKEIKNQTISLKTYTDPDFNANDLLILENLGNVSSGRTGNNSNQNTPISIPNNTATVTLGNGGGSMAAISSSPNLSNPPGTNNVTNASLLQSSNPIQRVRALSNMDSTSVIRLSWVKQQPALEFSKTLAVEYKDPLTKNKMGEEQKIKLDQNSFMLMAITGL